MSRSSVFLPSRVASGGTPALHESVGGAGGVINFAELAAAERLDLFSPCLRSPTETREAIRAFQGTHCALLFGEPPRCRAWKCVRVILSNKSALKNPRLRFRIVSPHFLPFFLFLPAKGCFPFFLPFHRLLSRNKTIKLESCTLTHSPPPHTEVKELVCSANVCEYLFIYRRRHNGLFCRRKQRADGLAVILHAGFNILLSLQAEPNGTQSLCVPRDPSLKCCPRARRDSSAALLSLVLSEPRTSILPNLLRPKKSLVLLCLHSGP